MISKKEFDQKLFAQHGVNSYGALFEAMGGRQYMDALLKFLKEQLPARKRRMLDVVIRAGDLFGLPGDEELNPHLARLPAADLVRNNLLLEQLKHFWSETGISEFYTDIIEPTAAIIAETTGEDLDVPLQHPVFDELDQCVALNEELFGLCAKNPSLETAINKAVRLGAISTVARHRAAERFVVPPAPRKGDELSREQLIAARDGFEKEHPDKGSTELLAEHFGISKRQLQQRMKELGIA